MELPAERPEQHLTSLLRQREDYVRTHPEQKSLPPRNGSPRIQRIDVAITSTAGFP